MNKFENDLARELKAANLLSEESVALAIADAERSRVSLVSYLVSKKMIREDLLLPLIAQLSGITYVSMKQLEISPEALKAVPMRFAWHYEIMPIRLEGSTLTIALNSPLTVKIQDEIRMGLGYEIAAVLAKKEEILDALKHHYGLGSDTVDKMVGTRDSSGAYIETVPGKAIDDIEKLAGDASVIRLVNQIIFEAYRKRATDIHIETFRDIARVRYRIDGVLYEQHLPEGFHRFLNPILSRIKIMSNLNIVERRMPQDGRAIVKTQDQVLDLRVSFIPTLHGESVVIRLLPTKMLFHLEKLGFAAKDLALVESLITRPNGIIFVTGPTGSGKSTTLYACLNRINKNERKIITIEDPVEYEMDGVTQIQVNPDVGLTFAAGLRSMLRHDPDIMMVGEVRDKETAEIAIRVALTGHLVLSTLHTNDAATGVTRLVDIGIEPYLIASSVEAFVAQRLVRVICTHCRHEVHDTDSFLKERIAKGLGLASVSAVKTYKSKGCEQCNFTGFYGRTAIYEILLVDDVMRRMIAEGRSAAAIKQHAVANGMRTLLQDGWAKVMDGVTTPEEVLEVTQDLDMDIAAIVPEAGPVDSASVIDNPVSATPHSPQTPTVSPQPLYGPAEAPFPNERRIHTRVDARIKVEYHLVEKGAGRIIKLMHKTGGNEYESVFAEEIFESNDAENAGALLEESTVSVNISAGGLVLESQYMIPLGSILEMNITISHGDPIKCLSKVVRIEKDLPRCFYIVVCYMDMSGVDRVRIDEYVKKSRLQL